MEEVEDVEVAAVVEVVVEGVEEVVVVVDPSQILMPCHWNLRVLCHK